MAKESKKFFNFKKVMLGIPLLWATHMVVGEITYGQAPSPITTSGLNTQISAPVNLPGGAVQHNITGGTRPGGGANLFHSFGEFGVPTNNIANFLNDAALPTTNILSRVTGGNPSNILGMIQTEGFGNANLFLMNPAGILFGPDASLNVGGSTHFTTADYLRLGDGVQFTALPSAHDALLSVAPVEAFGFLGSNPSPISVEGSTLSGSEGQTFSLVGGDVTFGSGLNAPSGKIAIASVASPGEVLAESFVSDPNVNGHSFTTMGNIVLSEGATLDVSGNAAGTVIIRGGNLMMTNATISADTGDSSGAAVAVDINIQGSISIANDSSSAFTAKATGAGDAGEINLQSENLTVESSISDFSTAIIDTSNLGTGNSGHVNLNMETGNLIVDGGPFQGLFIESGSGGDGNGGNVTIKAGNAEFINTEISTGDSKLMGFGAGGNFAIQANSMTMEGVTFTTDSLNLRGGDLTFDAHNITFSGSSIGVLSLFGEAVIDIHANHFVMDNSNLLNQTALAPGGGIIVNAASVELMNNSQIASQTFGDGDAGKITVTATDHVTISDDPTIGFAPGGLFTNAFGVPDLGINGKAGGIEVITPLLTMTGGTRINTTTESSGAGGDVTINAQQVSLSGQRNFEDGSSIFGLGGTKATGIYTRTIGSLPDTCTDSCGRAGNVSITTGLFNLAQGARVDSGTSSTGVGGTINVNASGNISITGTLDEGTTPGGVFSQTIGTDPNSGAGGTIALTAGQNFTLSDGAAVSASSTGTGNSGSISITTNSGNAQVNQGSISTAATQAEAGNITIAAAQSVNLSNLGGILSLTLGDGKAGDISIHSENLLLNGGRIFANSGGPNSTGQFVVGTGDAGNIAVEARNIMSLSNNGIISSSTVGNGRGGDIAISAKQLVVSTASQILTDTGSFDVTGPVSGQGQGGTVTVRIEDSVDLNRGQILTRTLGAGDAGDIVVETTQLNISNGGGLFATSGIPDVDGNLVTGIGSAGDITVTATESLSLSGADSFISSATGGAGNGGPISLQTGRLMVDDHAGVIATSGLFDRSGNFIVGQGNAGSITIEAAESASVSNGGLVSSSTGGGVGGVVSLSTPELVLSGGAIQARTVGDAPGGSISIQTGDLTMSNGAEMNTGSGLQNNPTGVLLAAKGDGGNISVSASQSIHLSTGAQISTESLGEGNAGQVNLTTEGNFQGDDSMVSTSAQQAAGGDIIIAAGKDVQLRNNTTVSAESFGAGNAGNITITAPDTLLIDKAIVTTKADQASGGNIKLTAGTLIQLTDSEVTSRVQEGSGSAGSINLDPDFIVIKNSQVLSTAEFGDGGPITLTANSAILVDPFSRLDASSQFGGSGKVDLQAPIQNLSGTIVPLPQDPVPVTALYGSRCVAGAGGHFSTFVDSKADSLAPTPGTFLASPFLPLSNLSKSGELGDAGMPTGDSGTSQAPHLQVAVYSPPVLFGQGDEMLTACP